MAETCGMAVESAWHTVARCEAEGLCGVCMLACV